MAVDMCYFCKNNCVKADSTNCKNYVKGKSVIHKDDMLDDAVNKVLSLVYRDD